MVFPGVVSLIPGGAHRETQCPWSTQRTLWPKTPGEVFVPEVSTTPTDSCSAEIQNLHLCLTAQKVQKPPRFLGSNIWNNSIALGGILHCLVRSFEVNFVKDEIFKTSCRLNENYSPPLAFLPVAFQLYLFHVTGTWHEASPHSSRALELATHWCSPP